MSRTLLMIFEYDGDYPESNTFLCEMYDFQYSSLRRLNDLYMMETDPPKKHSIEAEEFLEDSIGGTFSFNDIAGRIEKLKKDIEHEELDEKEEAETKKVISDLQELRKIIMKKCKKKNIDSEKFYIVWRFSF
jgi:hypothetical protein